MQVQITTDNHVEGGQGLTDHVEAKVENAFVKYADRLTRVIVHFTDENSHKNNGNDKKCSIEVRPAGHQPLAATNLAGSVHEALDGAVTKIEHMLEHTFGRMDHHKGRTPMGGPTG
jgi:ribosomal subunit interface protein